jgi:esterase/lipase superfamily enzyme
VYKAVVAAASGGMQRTFRAPGGAPAASSGSSGTQAIAATPARHTIVPVLFATDRKWVGGDDYFSGERGELRFGKVSVSVPDDHRLGELEKPRWWRLEFRQDPARHVMVLGVEDLAEASWKARLAESLEQAGRDDILLFIHGYHVSFADAARRAAQFAYDLQFAGVTAFYSWPSEGRVASYTIDENNAHWTLEHFENTLRLLLQESGASNVYAVAHSMGNRVLTEGIRRVASDLGRPGWSRLRELIFAAPDIDADSFRKFAETFHRAADRLTLYASSLDKALVASRKIHRYARAGDAGDDIVIVEGLDSIDASAVDTSLLGHSYFGDNRSVISDIYNLLRSPGQPATGRFGIRAKRIARGQYFWFSP